MRRGPGWCRAWRLGRLEFEIEWVPRGRFYSFCFQIKSPQWLLDEMERPYTQPEPTEKRTIGTRG